MTDVTMTFPDGASRPVKSGTTGLEIAKSISPSLAKRTVAMSLDGKLCRPRRSDHRRRQDQIHRPHRPGSARADPARRRARDGGGGAVAVARHAGHDRPGDRERLLLRLRQAGARSIPTISPKIEKRMHEIIAEERAVHEGGLVAARRPRTSSGSKGENFKVELVDAIPEGEDLKIYKQGEWLDLCRGPHMTSTGQVGKAFKLQKFAGAYWRGDSNKPQLQRIYGTAWATEEELARPTCTSSRKPRSATTASSAARWTSSISRKRRRARSSGIRRAGPCSRR